jgi:hypothetical protein
MGQVLLVVALALATGLVVYRLSLRREGTGSFPATGFGDGATAEDASEIHPAAYVPLAPGRRSWQTRVMGVAGIVIVVVLASAVLAVALYMAGHAVNEVFKDFTGDNGSVLR